MRHALGLWSQAADNFACCYLAFCGLHFGKTLINHTTHMMTHDEIVKVIKAIHSGEKIQTKISTGEWRDAGNHTLIRAMQEMAICFEFRVKTTPKLRPWKPEEGVGKAVAIKGDHASPWVILSIIPGSGFYGQTPQGYNAYNSAQWYLEHCEQLDGSPCGVEE